MRKKSAGAVSIIGDADGPTSVFIASKPQKLTLKQKFQKKRLNNLFLPRDMWVFLTWK